MALLQEQVFSKQRHVKSEILILASACSFGLIFWFVDALVDYWFFYKKLSFIDILLLNIPAHELYIRSSVLGLFCFGGILVQKLYRHIKQVQRSVVENEQKYKQFFENFTEGFALHEIILDEHEHPIDYRFLAVNSAFKELTGLQHRTVVGRTVRELLPGIENDPANWIETYAKVALTGEPIRLENFSQPIGKWFLIQAFCPEHGQFAVTFTDITEQRQIHETIRNLAKFPEENPNPVMRFDDQGTILYANDASQPLLTHWHCSQQEIIPEHMLKNVSKALNSNHLIKVEQDCNDKVYLLCLAPIQGTRFVNLYAFDITQRKELELNLKESEQRFRLIMQQSPSVIELYDLNGVQINVNHAYETLWGFPASHTIGKFNVLESEEIKRTDLIKYVHRAYNGETVTVPEYEYDARVNTQGKGQSRLRWLRTSIYPIKDDHDEVRNIVIIHEDITDRKRAELQVLEQKRRLSALISNVPGMCYRCVNNINWTMEFISQGALELTGYSPDDFLRQEVNYGQLIHRDDHNKVWDEVQSAILQKHSFELYYRIICKDGREKWIWERGLPVFDKLNNLLALEGIMADITEQKLAEFKIQDMLKREQSLADIIRNAPMAIGVGYPDGQLDMCNTAFTTLTGYTEEELKSVKWNTVLTPKKWQAQESEFLSQIRHDNDSVQYEKEYQRKDGSLIPIELVVTARFNPKNQPEYYIGFVSDITERKKNETQARLMQESLIERQRYEKKLVQEELAKVKDELVRKTQLAAIGQVSASIAHDLRNPLACVRNANYLLKHRLKSNDPKHLKPLEIIDYEVQKADKIISNLLSIAKSRPPQKETVCLKPLVESVLQRFKDCSNVTFTCTCLSDSMTIQADPAQIDQVLVNLITNAIQALDGPGTIEVKATKKHEFDQISVIDSGVGISEHVREHLFEPLVTTKSRGTGLGLTICQQIVELHGGIITACNARGGGTEMRFQLPQSV